MKHPLRDYELAIYITYRCNLACGNCAAGVSRFVNGVEDMSVDQVRDVIEQALSEGWQFKRIFVTGGEPTRHPQIVEILQVLREYQPRGKYQIALQSNGVNVDQGVVQKVMWMGNWTVVNNVNLDLAFQGTDIVIDSQKYLGVPAHKTMYQAPIDLPEFAQYNAFDGCGFLTECPIIVNKYGFYACGPGATIDKAIGRDLGVKRIKDLKARIPEQLNAFCRLCGEFKFYVGLPFKESKEWVLSPSWQNLKKRFDEDPPRLTSF